MSGHGHHRKPVVLQKWGGEESEIARVARDYVHVMRRVYGAGTPHRAAPTPKRNEPCPCGSGNKFKRCCGAA